MCVIGVQALMFLGNPLKYKGAKRHSSTGDALELFRGNLQLQKRLRDLEAGNSTSSLGSNGKLGHRITDF